MRGFLFLQGIAFLHTISRGIGYCTVTPVPDRTHKTISPQITAVLNVYRSQGLNACDIHADNEFECIRGEILPTEQNVLTADSHVGEVERSIRTIKKERLRSCVHGLPFLSRLPKIVTGVGTPNYTVMCLELGTYAKVFEDNNPTNTPRSRLLGAIALDPTGNSQGDYYFMSLATGARLSRHNWSVLPLPNTAIARVEALLALNEGRPLIQERGFVVEWRPDHPIDDSDYNVDVAPPDFVPDDFFEAADYVPLDPTELDNLANPFVRFDPAVPNKPPTQGAGADAVVDHDEADFPVDDAFDHDEADFPVDDYNNDVDTAFVDIFDADDEKEGTQGAAPAYDNLQGASTENTDAYHGTQEEGAATAGDDAQQQEEGAAPAAGNDAQHQGAQGAPNSPPTYNLRPRAAMTQRSTFNQAMDNPHDGKLFYAPTQLLQSALAEPSQNDMDHKRRVVFNFILAQMGTTCTQMSERAGLRKHGTRGPGRIQAP